MTTQLDAELRLRLLDEVSATARQIEDRMRGVGDATDAAAREASQAFEAMRIAEMQAAAEARRLEGEIRRLQAAGSAGGAEIDQLQRALIRAKRGAAEYGAEARRVAAAQQQMGATAAKARPPIDAQATELAAATKASKAHTRGMAESVNMTSEMMLGFGGLSPTVRELGIAFAMGGNNAVVMANALGPLGIALGVATGLVPQLITMLVNAGDEMDQFGDSTKTAAERQRDLATAVRERLAEQRREQELERGRARIEEHEEEVAIARASLTAAQGGEGAAHRRVRDRAKEAFAGRADAPALRAVLEESLTSGRSASEVLREHAARGTTFGRLEGQRSSTSEINLRNAIATLSHATAGDREQLPELRTARVEAERQLEMREEQLGLARTNQRAAEEREAIESAPQRIRQQLGDLATTARLSDAQRAQLLASAERGRGLSPALTSALGGRAGSAQDLAARLGAAERAAASARLDEAAGENVTLGLPTPDGAVERVRRRERRGRSGGSFEDGLTSGQVVAELGPDALRELQGLERQVTVRVQVEDSRVAYDVTQVDASAADLTGGQQ